MVGGNAKFVIRMKYLIMNDRALHAKKWHEGKQNSNRLYGFSKLAIRPQPGKASRKTRKPKGINEGAEAK